MDDAVRSDRFLGRAGPCTAIEGFDDAVTAGRAWLPVGDGRTRRLRTRRLRTRRLRTRRLRTRRRQAAGIRGRPVHHVRDGGRTGTPRRLRVRHRLIARRDRPPTRSWSDSLAGFPRRALRATRFAEEPCVHCGGLDLEPRAS